MDHNYIEWISNGVFLFSCRESEIILDSDIEIADATLGNEESNQQGAVIYPLLDDRTLHDDMQNLPVTR